MVSPCVTCIVLSAILVRPDPTEQNSCVDVAFQHVEIPAGHELLWDAEAGDVDGDGDQDLVAIGRYPWYGFLSVRKNRGDGTFDTPTLYVAGGDPLSVKLADVDKDGDLDVILTNWPYVFVYMNQGDGSLDDPIQYPFPEGVRTVSVAVKDLDQDGWLDLAVSDAYGSLWVLWNLGNGTFEYGWHYTFPSNYDWSLYEVIAEDLNGDGWVDVAAMGFPTDLVTRIMLVDDAKVFVFFNDGHRGFSHQAAFHIPSWPTLALKAADLDGDGDIDLAGVNSPNARPDPNGMWVIFNDGMGHFGPATVYPVGPWPHDVKFADMDRDGDLDAVVANHNAFDFYPPPHDVSILLNRGDGTFEPEKRELVGERPSAVISVDVDGDLDLDIAVANFGWYGPSSISILFNRCDPCDLDRDSDVDLFDYVMFHDCFAGPGSGAIEECAPADLDGDGDVDLRDWAGFVTAFTGS